MIRTDVAVIQGAARLAADNQTLYCLANDGGQQLIYACTPSETSPYGRVLEAEGYRVGVIAQPNVNDHKSLLVFGAPRLG